MTTLFALVGFLYLCLCTARLLLTAYLTIKNWTEMKKDEPEIKADPLKTRISSFLFLFMAMWFMLPLNAVAELQRDAGE